jgi:hypothetical protein
MATGTSLIALKQALVTALRARAGLASVQILYGPDDFEAGDDHLQEEAIWLGNALWTNSEIPVMKAGTKEVAETFELEFFVQVLKSDGSSQETADLRAKALLTELQQALAEDPMLVAQAPPILWALLQMRRHVTGTLDVGPNHGSRFEGVIEVKARLKP